MIIVRIPIYNYLKNSQFHTQMGPEYSANDIRKYIDILCQTDLLYQVNTQHQINVNLTSWPALDSVVYLLMGSGQNFPPLKYSQFCHEQWVGVLSQLTSGF